MVHAVAEEKVPSRKILLIDDSRADATLFIQTFADEGLVAEIHWIKEGRLALQYLESEGPDGIRPKPDFIILDLNMPRMSGFEILSFIRTQETLSLVPVMVFSSSAAEADRLKAYRLGANAFVTKPVDLEDFAKAVRAMNEFWFKVVTMP